MSPVRTYIVEVAPAVLTPICLFQARASVPLRIEYGGALSRVGYGATPDAAIDQAARSAVGALVRSLGADIDEGDQPVDGLAVRFVVRELEADS